MAEKQARFHIVHGSNNRNNNNGQFHQHQLHHQAPPPTTIYDAVEVEEVHNGPTEEVSSGEFQNASTTDEDAMALTEIETETGLDLAFDAKLPRPLSPGMQRRPRVQSMPMEVTQVAMKPGKEKGRRGRKKRRATTALEEEDDGRTGQAAAGTTGRPFQLKWLLMYEWLRYDPDRKHMHCAWCLEAGKKNAFAKPEGTNNHRKSNCDEHQKSVDHRNAAEEHARKHQNFRKNLQADEDDEGADPMMKNVTAVRGHDGSIVYQGNATRGAPVQPAALELNPDLNFHAKKAHMLLSGFLSLKSLPASLCKDMLEIMPFMFPDSKIAAEIANLNFP
ncbi:hypothetical protein BV898_14526 [Hypsibius exemplaris]|uniref:C17orf113 probable zinc finger domain-containing protein n=1 Tax=Hypsibius exemplaris TaxID=2072580 RepID=A0A9X6N8S9_HYPEX|nr:hypothetical protein BV898_14526 [Hypsibius exemplaris]